jgi:hypothetical protein
MSFYLEKEIEIEIEPNIRNTLRRPENQFYYVLMCFPRITLVTKYGKIPHTKWCIGKYNIQKVKH